MRWVMGFLILVILGKYWERKWFVVALVANFVMNAYRKLMSLVIKFEWGTTNDSNKNVVINYLQQENV